ncbi:MAG TPA: serine/threonine-protein kinase [Candidatus Dormibacteraeota bacterium]|nr:serine/threonine-protein kinase [Candidatus Dormibacteraeota bacterium]
MEKANLETRSTVSEHTGTDVEFDCPDYSGTTVGGYQLVRKIAEGGMGVVYEGIQTNLSRRVAVKILTEQLATRPEFLQRFQREAKAAAALSHPNMVQVHDFCQAEGRCCLVMEYVDGQDLSERTQKIGKWAIHEALGAIEQAAMALGAACAKSIVHRDIKPSNLMLSTDGTVKVSDLGLAKILSENSDLTMTGIGMGSPYFMAPEQASDAREVDHRADIYSLGLTLLYLLTGKRPFEGNTPFSIVLAQANKPLPRGVDLGTELPSEVERLLHKMAAKNPDERHLDYASLLEDIRRVKAGYAPAIDLNNLKRKLLSQRTMALAASVVLGIFVVSLAIALKRSKTAQARPTTTAAAVPAPRPAEPERPALREPMRERDGFPSGPMMEGPEREESRNPPAQLNSEGPMPLPFGRLPRQTPNPLKDAAPESMLAEADRYASANPQNFRDQVDRYRQVLAKAEGLPLENEVNRKMNRVMEQHQAALRQSIQDFTSRMRQELAAHGPQAAYDVWKTFPMNLRSPESDRQVLRVLQNTLPPDFMSHAGAREGNRE